jgi:serine/threonine-protein kinase HipA
MKKAKILINNISSGVIEELETGTYKFTYLDSYTGPPVSLTMPTRQRTYIFKKFPPFFEGLLPEGVQLDALLRQEKIDKLDYFSQLIAVGGDLVGTVTVRKLE